MLIQKCWERDPENDEDTICTRVHGPKKMRIQFTHLFTQSEMIRIRFTHEK